MTRVDRPKPKYDVAHSGHDDEARRYVAVLPLFAQREHENFVRIVLADHYGAFLLRKLAEPRKKLPRNLRKLLIILNRSVPPRSMPG